MSAKPAPQSTQSAFPKNGMPLDEILSLISELKQQDPGCLRLNANSMKGSAEVQEAGKTLFLEYFLYNAMYSVMVPSIGRIEDELLAMCVEIFNSGDEGRANITTGGTESIMSALHAMREWAKDTKQITKPELIVPYSAHAAFSKAAQYLGIKLIRTALQENFRADVQAMSDAIGPNTIGLVGSAPSWPYGRYDPINEISDLAVEKGLWLHVDACLGGYLAPFVKKAGYSIPDFDFGLPGVMSLSADLHKYGHAPKPISSVLWRSEEQQRYHYALVEDWPTGMYFTQAMTGSRPAGPVAAAWGIFKFLGEEGKVALAKQAMHIKELLTEGIARIDGLEVFENDLTPFMFYSDEFDIGQVMGGLSAKGWLMLGTPEPPMAQITLDSVEDELIHQFLSDLDTVVADIRAGKEVPTIALSYTFDENADLSGIPKWAQRAIPIMRPTESDIRKA